jgi:hypothetical protein
MMLKSTTAILFATAFCLAAPAHAQWYGGVDFLIPNRHTNSNTVFARNQVAPGPRVGTEITLGEENDLDLDLTAGGRVMLGNRSGMFGLEGSYVGTTEWHESTSVFDATRGLASPFTLPGTAVNPTFDSNSSIFVDYTSQLHTADFDITQNVYAGPNGNVYMLLGGRWMSIEESLTYTSDNLLSDHTILTTTDNQLFGPQLGVGIESPFCGGMVNMNFKSTLAYNTVDKTTDFDGVLAAGSDEDASFLSEITVDYVFFPTSNLSVRLGWYFLAATDIATAADNFERNPAVMGAGLVNIQTDRKVFYHSPYVGMVFSF